MHGMQHSLAAAAPQHRVFKTQSRLPPCRQSVPTGVHARRQQLPLIVRARKQAAPVEPVEQDLAEQQQQEQQQQSFGDGFSAAVQRLLHRAASSLTRGQTTCLTCRGQGTCTCTACNGSGITDRDARQNVMRHTAQKLRQVLHVERSEYHADWLTSNRCRRCHGTGVTVCPTCNGMGVRHAEPIKTQQQ